MSSNYSLLVHLHTIYTFTIVELFQLSLLNAEQELSAKNVKSQSGIFCILLYYY